MEGIRGYISSQLDRISAENSIRSELIQQDLDLRFAAADQAIKAVQSRLDERFRSQADVRTAEQGALVGQLTMLQETFTERLLAQKEAITAAITAADRAVQAALIASEKAISKAEVASDKRFESVNEFRKTLADQTATFVTRSEYGISRNAISDRVDAMSDRVSSLELRLTSRLDRGEGSDSGKEDSRNQQRLNISQIIAAIAVVATIASVLLLAFKK